MAMAYDRIRTDESLRETVRHGNEEYPFQYYLEDIWLFDFHCIDWHWHPEVELVYVKKGMADFYIGCDRHTLGAGTGIFINTQVIHRFESGESTVIPNIFFALAALTGIKPDLSEIYKPRACLVHKVSYILLCRSWAERYFTNADRNTGSTGIGKRERNQDGGTVVETVGYDI